MLDAGLERRIAEVLEACSIPISTSKIAELAGSDYGKSLRCLERMRDWGKVRGGNVSGSGRRIRVWSVKHNFNYREE